MSILSKRLAKASSIRCIFGNITPQKAFEIESEYRKYGNVKASTILDLSPQGKHKKTKSKSRQAVSLSDFQEHRRDITYLLSELSDVSSCRNTNVSYDSRLINYTTDVAYKINQCLQNIYADPNTKKLNHSSRCKNHACPYCNYVKQSTRQNHFQAGLSTINFDDVEYKYSSFITVSFKQKASNYVQVREQIKELNKAISKILGYRQYRNIVTGSVRSIEVIETIKTKQAHVHLHMLALVNKFKVITKKDLVEKLSTLTGLAVNVHIKNKLRPANSTKAQEKLIEGFNYMHKIFGLKTDDRFSQSKIFGNFSSSSIRRQSIEFYLMMLRGIKGQRLYNATGIFRKILKAGRIEFDARSPKYIKTDTPVYDRPLIHLYWSKKPTYIMEHDKMYDLGCYKISHETLDQFIHELDILGLSVRSKTYESSRILTQDKAKVFIYDKTSIDHQTSIKDLTNTNDSCSTNSNDLSSSDFNNQLTLRYEDE